MLHIIDIVLLALMLLIVLISAKRGIVLTVFDVASGLIAFLGAKLASPYVSEYVYVNFVKERVLAYLTGKYAGIESEISSAANNILSVFDFLPDGVTQYAKSSGFLDADAFASGVMNSVTTVSELEANVISPVIISLLKIVCFAVMALIFVIVLRIVGRLVAKFIKKSDVANKVDILLGGVFGILKGGIYVCIAAAIINVISYSSQQMAIYTANSYICSFVGKIIGL